MQEKAQVYSVDKSKRVLVVGTFIHISRQSSSPPGMLFSTRGDPSMLLALPPAGMLSIPCLLISVCVRLSFLNADLSSEPKLQPSFHCWEHFVLTLLFYLLRALFCSFKNILVCSVSVFSCSLRVFPSAQHCKPVLAFLKAVTSEMAAAVRAQWLC